MRMTKNNKNSRKSQNGIQKGDSCWNRCKPARLLRACNLSETCPCHFDIFWRYDCTFCFSLSHTRLWILVSNQQKHKIIGIFLCHQVTKEQCKWSECTISKLSHSQRLSLMINSLNSGAIWKLKRCSKTRMGNARYRISEICYYN